MSTVTGAAGNARLNLLRPGKEYNQKDEEDRNLSLETADKANFKKFEDVDLSNNERLILISPDGTRYEVKVANGGALSTSSVPNPRL
jgi:hypothetical protein